MTTETILSIAAVLGVTVLVVIIGLIVGIYVHEWRVNRTWTQRWK